MKRCITVAIKFCLIPAILAMLFWAMQSFPLGITNDKDELESNSAEAQLKLIRSLLKKNDVLNATEAAEKALKLFPANAPLYAAWGDVLFRTAKMKEATEAYQKAIQLDPDNARGYLGMAKLHSFNFNRKSMRIMDARAYACDPEDPEILSAYMGDLCAKDAIPLLEKYLKLAVDERKDRQQTIWDKLEYLQKRGDQETWQLINAPEKCDLKLESLRSSGRDLAHGYSFSAIINGKKVELALDTGAGGILINRKLANKLGLESISSMHINGIGDLGQRQGSLAMAQTIKIGPVEFKNCTVSLMESLPGEADADGIIGLKPFERFLIKLNLPKNILELHALPSINGMPFSDPESWKELDRTIPQELSSFTAIGKSGHLLAIPIVVNKLKSGFFFLDTGASQNIIDRRFAEQVTSLHSSSTIIRGISGTTKAFLAQYITLRMGKYQQINDGMLAIDMKEMSRRVGVEASGLLGHPMLRQFAIIIDYRDGLIDFSYEK